MLAVVDDLVDAGVQIGAGAAAEVAAPLNEVDGEAGFGKRAGSRDAGYAGADDGDALLLGRLRDLDSLRG